MNAQGENSMSHLDFFRKQAKNFFKDWRTQTKTVESDGFISAFVDGNIAFVAVDSVEQEKNMGDILWSFCIFIIAFQPKNSSCMFLVSGL